MNESEDEKEELLVSESSDESEAWDCETIVSTYSNLENHPAKIGAPGKPKSRLPPKSIPFPGDVGVGNDVITLGGKGMLPVNYLPQRRRIMEGLVREKLGSVEKPKKVVGEESKEEKKERKVTYFFFVTYPQFLSHFKIFSSYCYAHLAYWYSTTPIGISFYISLIFI